MTKQLSDGNPDGTVLGQSATDKIAFFGGTPVVKQTDSAFAALVSSLAISSQGFTSAGATSALATINAIVAALNAYDLTDAS